MKRKREEYYLVELQSEETTEKYFLKIPCDKVTKEELEALRIMSKENCIYFEVESTEYLWCEKLLNILFGFEQEGKTEDVNLFKKLYQSQNSENYVPVFDKWKEYDIKYPLNSPLQGPFVEFFHLCLWY